MFLVSAFNSFIKPLFKKAIRSFVRFPVTLLWAVLGSLYLIYCFRINHYNVLENHEGLILIIALGVSWLISMQFISEKLKHSGFIRFLLKILVLFGLFMFYSFVFEHIENINNIQYGKWLLLLFSGHLLLCFAPFINSWDKNKFWLYLKDVIISVLRSLLYTLILYAGLCLAIFSLESLFNITLNDYIYLQTFIFCLGIINTFIYLSDFPALSRQDTSPKLHKLGEVCIQYILIPLSFIYITIVYLYSLKIVLLWELPKGWVSYLIFTLCILAFILHIAVEPIRTDNNNKLIKSFFPYFFYALLPLIPLLFLALFRRIIDYNLTEFRYLGLVLALWIFAMILYMLLSKQKKLSMYPKSMFTLVMLCTFGPLSAFKISLNAQIDEFDKMLKQLEHYNSKTVSNEDYNRFRSIIKYLYYRNALDKTEPYIGFNPKQTFENAFADNITSKILDTLGFKIENYLNPYDSQYKYYYLSNFKKDYAEEITNFTHYTELILYKDKPEDKALVLHFNEKNLIKFMYYDDLLFETDLDEHFKTVLQEYKILNNAPQDEFTFRFKNEKGDFLIIFERLQFYYHQNILEIKEGYAKVFYRTFESLELP